MKQYTIHKQHWAYRMQPLVLYLLTVIMTVFTLGYYAPSAEAASPNNTSKFVIADRISDNSIQSQLDEVKQPKISPDIPEPTAVAEPDMVLSKDDIELIALVTMAEAGGEPELGQRLVVDTILNRVDSPVCPNTVEGVVYQEGQYTCVSNGAINRCYVQEDIVQLIEEELFSRTNSEVWFFRTKRYSSYGVPMFQVGHHYFSSYT